MVSNSFHHRGADPLRIRFWSTPEPGRFVNCVEDNGMGIPEPYLNLVFEPFRKVDPSGTSRGLGLTYCRKVIRQHRGEIWAESEEGGGTRIFFALPAFPMRDRDFA